MRTQIRIGTRGSPLALAQAAETRARLIAGHEELTEANITIVPIKTSGDKIQDRQLLLEGGKGLFTKEIEDHLLASEIDIAVHSTKDMPATLPEGIIIGAFLPREDPRDAFLSPIAKSIHDLPKGAVVGTSSLRRQAQVLKVRPDLEVVAYRGNVGTRIKKMNAGEVVATFLAAAGLNRLGMGAEITSYLSLDEMLPAPGQGAICIQTRQGDDKTDHWLKPLNCDETTKCVTAERAVSLALGASCRMPLAAHAALSDNQLTLRAALFRPDGKEFWAVNGQASCDDPEVLGAKLAKELLAVADPKLIKKFRDQ